MKAIIDLGSDFWPGGAGLLEKTLSLRRILDSRGLTKDRLGVHRFGSHVRMRPPGCPTM
jgi:hypothetical protein